MTSLQSERFDSNCAKDALGEILRQIDEDQKLRQTREACSNDMLRYVQNFVPLTMEVQFKIIAKYGFSPDNTGLLNFTNQVKELCAEDDSVASLFERFKCILIPSLSLKKVDST